MYGIRKIPKCISINICWVFFISEFVSNERKCLTFHKIVIFVTTNSMVNTKTLLATAILQVLCMNLNSFGSFLWHFSCLKLFLKILLFKHSGEFSTFLNKPCKNWFTKVSLTTDLGQFLERQLVKKTTWNKYMSHNSYNRLQVEVDNRYIFSWVHRNP